jgi:hypothetical protein
MGIENIILFNAWDGVFYLTKIFVVNDFDKYCIIIADNYTSYIFTSYDEMFMDNLSEIIDKGTWVTKKYYSIYLQNECFVIMENKKLGVYIIIDFDYFDRNNIDKSSIKEIYWTTSWDEVKELYLKFDKRNNNLNNIFLQNSYS